MQLQLFAVPVKSLAAAEGEMNGFLRAHRVLAVKKEFVADGENSFWTFCVEYLDSPAGAGSWPGHQSPCGEGATASDWQPFDPAVARAVGQGEQVAVGFGREA